MDVGISPPFRLAYGGENELMVYPSIGVIIRSGPRGNCTKNHEHQVYEGPPNFVVEIELTCMSLTYFVCSMRHVPTLG